MTTESSRSRPQSSNTRPLDAARSAQNAALQGAAKAFGKPPVKPKPGAGVSVGANSSTGVNNAALAAATKAGRDARINSVPVSVNHTGSQAGDGRLTTQITGSSVGYGSYTASPELGLVRHRLNQLVNGGGSGYTSTSGSDQHLQLRGSGTPNPGAKSPSSIAANLAASRSAPTSPVISGHLARPGLGKQRLSDSNSIRSQLSESGRSSSPGPVLEVREDAVLDTSHIPPTNSLIGMFENPIPKKPVTKAKNVSGTSTTAEMISSQPEIKLSKPARSSTDFGKRTPEITRTAAVMKSSVPEIQSPKPIRATSNFTKVPPVLKTSPQIPSPKPVRRATDLSKAAPALPAKPIAIPPRRGDNVSRASMAPSVQSRNTTREAPVDDDASSNDSFVSASDHMSAPSSRRPPQRPVSASYNSMTVNALANAMVAGAIASSRATSPSKKKVGSPPPVPPPRRNNHSLFHHHHVQDSRTPSPAKGLRQTMRKPPKDEEEEDVNMLRRGRKNIMKKHPNKHHEGDRKRWRDSVTERERKRYEAVWASNRGIYVPETVPIRNPPTPPTNASNSTLLLPSSTSSEPSDCVSNLVVRDIWSRSRLSADVLSEVWELVDRSGAGRLSKEEFVAGMWLIDQRLKGRKLPIRVSDSVWSSLGGLGGVRVKGNKKKGR